jgi:hypothetical protein
MMQDAMTSRMASRILPASFPHPSRTSSIYFLPAPALPIRMLVAATSIPSSMGSGIGHTNGNRQHKLRVPLPNCWLMLCRRKLINTMAPARPADFSSFDPVFC